MTGTLTCNPVQGVEGFWIRPSRQIVTLRFRHSLISKDPKDREKRGEDTIAVEGTLELPEEQATTEFSGWVGGTTDSMTLEGVAGEIIQGVPERVGWMSGATISGNFCKDGVEGKLMGVWSAKAHATKMRPLGPGGMRINVGLLPDRLVASQGIVDSSEGRDGIKPLTEPVGKRGGMHQSSDCRYICVVGGGNGDNSTSTVGHGFSALSFGPALGTAALASVEVYPHFGGHDDPSFPDSITWGNDLTPDENVVTVVDSSVSKGQYVKTLTTPHGQSPPPPLPSTSATVDAEAALDPVPLQVPGSSGVIATDGVSSNTGYVRGTWLWEWRILCCTSRMTVGICSYVVANRAGAPQIPSGGTEGGNSGDNIGSSDAKTVGDSKDLWGYRSDGYFVRGTEASESPCPGGGFESGDVVGVELDIDAGSVCFLKNGYYVGDKVLGVGQSESCKAQGVLPCISLRCGGDSALLLGLKEGEGALIHKVVEEAKGDTAEEGVGGEEAAGEDAGDEIFQGGGARQEEVGVRRGGELEEGDGHGEVVDEQKADGEGGGGERGGGHGEVVEERQGEGERERGGEDVGEGNVEGTENEADGKEDSSNQGGVAEGANGVYRVDTLKDSLPLWPASFQGRFENGQKHGPGVLTLASVRAVWRGHWFMGVQHGVHLLLTPSSNWKQKEVVEDWEDEADVSAWMFDKGVKVREASDEEAIGRVREWEGIRDKKQEERRKHMAKEEAARKEREASAAGRGGGKGSAKTEGKGSGRLKKSSSKSDSSTRLSNRRKKYRRQELQLAQQLQAEKHEQLYLLQEVARGGRDEASCPGESPEGSEALEILQVLAMGDDGKETDEEEDGLARRIDNFGEEVGNIMARLRVRGDAKETQGDGEQEDDREFLLVSGDGETTDVGATGQDNDQGDFKDSEEDRGDKETEDTSSRMATVAVVAASVGAGEDSGKGEAEESSGAKEPGEEDVMGIEMGDAEYLLRVVYPKGATMRDGLEIDESSVVGNLPYGAVTTASVRIICSCGIPRLKTPNGWISERLRGGMEEDVVVVLRHCPPEPIRYLVICPGGAMVRETPELEGPEAKGGGCSKGTMVSVDERRRLPDGTMRLRVVEPVKKQGWISEKPHIICREVSAEEEALQAEGVRRQLVVAKRAEARAREAEARKREEELTAEGRSVEVEVTGSFEVSAKCFFLFDRARLTGSVNLSKDLGTATCTGSGNRGMVLGSRGFRGGVHYWEVRVDRCNWGSVFIGVAPRYSSAWSGYGFLNYRACQAYGSETLYGAYYAAGDRVGVLLDMDRGTVSFVKDGDDFNMGRPVVVNMGIAYHHLRRLGRSDAAGRYGLAMYPCFGMKCSGDQMTVRGQKWLSRRGLGHARRVRQAVDAIVAARQLQRSLAMGSQPPKALMKAARGRYLQWREGRLLSYPTRGGVSIDVDVTDAALLHAVGDVADAFGGIQVGQRLDTPYGEGSILGTFRRDIWFVLDGNDSGAWYWTREELGDLLNSARLRLLEKRKGSGDTDAGDGKPAPPPIQHNALGATDSPSAQSHTSGPAPTPETINKMKLAAGPTPTQFAALASEGWGSLAVNEALVRLVNVVAGRQGVLASHLSAEDLVKATEAAGPAVGGVLAGHGSEQLGARVLLLLEFNEQIEGALPLLDLAREDSAPLALTIHDQRWASCVPSMDVGIRSRSGRAVADLRGLMLTQTKMRYWNLVVQETTTFTLPNPDEYERPDDIREVEVNRVKARSAAVEGDALSFNEKRRASLLGQLFKSMADWDGRNLRRSFVHMQDAGQARAFYVRFKGEGVDDHGGPYRALFQTAMGEEPAGLLGLLVPCPNGRNRYGPNQDKLLFNAYPGGSADPHRLMLFHHMGRLLGVAGRHRVHVPLALPSLVWKPLVGSTLGAGDLEALDKMLAKGLKDIAACRMDAEEEREILEEALLANAGEVGEGAKAGGAVGGSIGGRDSGVEGGGGGGQGGVSATSGNGVGGGRGRWPLSLLPAPGQTLDPQQRRRAVRAVEQLRLTANVDCLEILFRGLASVLPVELLVLFTAAEVEALFCGVPEVDVDLLQRATEYDGVGPTEPHVLYFWQALRRMDSEERSAFVNFCSGRSRLPGSAAEFAMNFKLTAPHRDYDKPDNYLPIAQTCFFSLALPKYSSADMCLEKLRYAIKNADLMDADYLVRSADGWEHLR